MERCRLAKKTKKKKWTSYGLEFKIQAVKRVAAGERPTLVSRELGLEPCVLYRWRKQYASLGAAGRPRITADAPVATPEETAARRIAELERKVGQQEVHLDFLRRAFERVKDLRRPKNVSGADASTERSK
jgi:transposase-like protein